MYGHEVPTAEELSVLHNGLTFEQFKQLSNEEVEAIRQDFNTRFVNGPVMVADEKGDIGRTPEGDALWGERSILMNFTRWRKYGVPDREVSSDDLAEYAIDLLQSRRQADPNYGCIPAKHFEGWSEDTLHALHWVLDYCYHMRGLDEQPSIDTYSLRNTIGLAGHHVESLVKHGVLSRFNSYTGPDNRTYEVYYLKRPYFDSWFAQIVTWEEEN